MASSKLSDIELRCCNCGDEFVFSAGEQELNLLRGAPCRPRACPRCRKLLGQ
ncbi:MAG TPA: zinc-ribbon domain containing protein [Chloroflexota bacterium]|nr:zinc-ribbon domain containing protein [Chloroflexota bacterium]